MAIDQFSRLVYQHATLQSQSGMSMRKGYVHEVARDANGQKIRCVFGIKPDGTPLIGPWCGVSTIGGGAGNEQKLYEKGQAIIATSVDGRWDNAIISPGQESDAHPAPAHAQKVNGDSAQLGKLRISKHKPKEDDGEDFIYNIWIAEDDDNVPKHKEQTGQDESGGESDGLGSFNFSDDTQQQQSERKAGKAKLKLSVSNKGIVGRYGKNINFSALEDGVKITANKQSVIVTKEGKIIMTKPPIIGQDPLDNLLHDFDEA